MVGYLFSEYLIYFGDLFNYIVGSRLIIYGKLLLFLLCGVFSEIEISG